jgi:hypothetical protein
MFLTGARAIAGYGFATASSFAATFWVPPSMPLASMGLGFAALLAAIGVLAVLWPAFRRDVAAIVRSRAFVTASKETASSKKSVPDRTDQTNPDSSREPANSLEDSL